MCGVIFFEKICIPSLKLVKPGPHCGRERNHPGSDAVPYEEPEMIIVMNQEIVLNFPRIDIIRRKANPVWIKLRELLKQGREEGIFHFRSLDHTMITVLGVILFHKRDADSRKGFERS